MSSDVWGALSAEFVGCIWDGLLHPLGPARAGGWEGRGRVSRMAQLRVVAVGRSVPSRRPRDACASISLLHSLLVSFLESECTHVHCRSVEGEGETCQGLYQAWLAGALLLKRTRVGVDGWMDG